MTGLSEPDCSGQSKRKQSNIWPRDAQVLSSWQRSRLHALSVCRCCTSLLLDIKAFVSQMGTATWQCRHPQAVWVCRCCTSGVLDAGGFCCDSGALDDCGVCDGDSQSCALHVVLTTTVRGGTCVVAGRGADGQHICMTDAFAGYVQWHAGRTAGLTTSVGLLVKI